MTCRTTTTHPRSLIFYPLHTLYLRVYCCCCAAPGCPVDIRLTSNETPLLMAVRLGCMSIVQLCLESGAHFEPDAEHGEKKTKSRVDGTWSLAGARLKWVMMVLHLMNCDVLSASALQFCFHRKNSTIHSFQTSATRANNIPSSPPLFQLEFVCSSPPFPQYPHSLQSQAAPTLCTSL